MEYHACHQIGKTLILVDVSQFRGTYQTQLRFPASYKDLSGNQGLSAHKMHGQINNYTELTLLSLEVVYKNGQNNPQFCDPSF